MSNKSRQPKGIPTGGQFAASAHAEAEGVDLHPETGESTLDVYGDTDQCIAVGAHKTAVDDDGYCQHCGDDGPWDDDMNDDMDDEGSLPLFEFQAPGSSSTFAVRVIPGNDYEGEERDNEYELHRDGTYVGSFDYTGDPDAHDEIQAAALVTLPAEVPPAGRDACSICGAPATRRQAQQHTVHFTLRCGKHAVADAEPLPFLSTSKD